MNAIRVTPSIDWSFYVQWWYDRSLRLWTIRRVDKQGNQIGEAEYEAHRVNASKTAHEMSNVNGAK